MRLIVIIAAGCVLAGVTGCETPTDRAESTRLINDARPIYPVDAERRGLGGKVVVDCTISETGIARDCTVTSASDPIFVPGTLSFLAEARYSPALRNGIPVAAPHHRFTINYRLDEANTWFTARCDVQPSGVVQGCRSEAAALSALWPLAKAALESVTAVPSGADGHPVDDPNRAVTVSVVISGLPLTRPEPRLRGDIVMTLPIACDRDLSRDRSPATHCKVAKDGTPDGLTHYRIDLGITGIVQQPTGDFSQ